MKHATEYRGRHSLAIPIALSIAAIAAGFSASARAQSLLEVFDAARLSDASYRAAVQQYEANLAKADQGKAGLMPTIGLNISNETARYANENPLVERGFDTRTRSLNASQPIYRPANWAAYKQGLKQVDLAKAQLDAAEQDLVVRVSQAYFDVLAALDALNFARAQKTAVAEQFASAKRSFEIGTASITDTREAQARYDLGVSQEIAAGNELLVKKLSLDMLTGRTDVRPKGLIGSTDLPPILPTDVNAWVDQAASVHPFIRQTQSNYDIADLEVDRAEAGHKPTLDLTAANSSVRSPNGTNISALATRHTTASMGLVLNLPLFAGLSTQNRIREALALKEKASIELEGAQRTVAFNTRALYFSLQSALSQVKALEAAEQSSQSALEANKMGYQVGIRINIDILNAQSQLFQIKRDLAQARYGVYMGGLKLRQANGSLTRDDLEAINARLEK